MLSRSHPMADGTVHCGGGIGGTGVLLTVPQLSVSQRITMCMSEVKEACGALPNAMELAIAVRGSIAEDTRMSSQNAAQFENSETVNNRAHRSSRTLWQRTVGLPRSTAPG